MKCIARIVGNRHEISRVTDATAEYAIREGWHLISRGTYKRIMRTAKRLGRQRALRDKGKVIPTPVIYRTLHRDSEQRKQILEERARERNRGLLSRVYSWFKGLFRRAWRWLPGTAA